MDQGKRIMQVNMTLVIVEKTNFEHLIKTVDNHTLKHKCIRKEWTLAEFSRRSGKTEDVSMQMFCMQNQRVKTKVAKLE